MGIADPGILPRKLGYQFSMLQLADHVLGRDSADRILGSYRQRLREQVLETLPERAPEPTPVERVRDLSRDDFIRHYREPGIPVVLEGAAADWPCCKRWTIEDFKQSYGDDEVLLNDHDDDQEEGFNDDLKLRITTLREALTLLDNENYVRFYPLFQRHPERLADMDMQWLLERSHRPAFAQHWQVFIGGKGGHTPYHHAAAGNLFVQVQGAKQWQLMPVAQSAYLDPQTRYGISRGPSISMHNPIYERIPHYELTLEPGDVLWNPPYMWHTVTNTEDSLALGYRWLAPQHAMRISPVYTISDLTQMHPPMWQVAKLAKEELALVPLLLAIRSGKVTDPQLIAYAEKHRTKAAPPAATRPDAEQVVA